MGPNDQYYASCRSAFSRDVSQLIVVLFIQIFEGLIQDVVDALVEWDLLGAKNTLDRIKHVGFDFGLESLSDELGAPVSSMAIKHGVD